MASVLANERSGRYPIAAIKVIQARDELQAKLLLFLFVDLFLDPLSIPKCEVRSSQA